MANQMSLDQARRILAARAAHAPINVLAAAIIASRHAQETWRPVPGYPPYRASSHGGIKGYGGKVLTPGAEYDVLHWDGDRRNNRLVNLRWGTPQENNADQDRHGRRIQAERHPRAKLTVADTLEIRRRLAAGETVMEISEDFDVHYRTVWNAAHSRTWRKLQTADGAFVHTTAWPRQYALP